MTHPALPAPIARHSHLALILLCLALWLPGFFTLPTTDRDEGRFAQATKQMLETGDFVRIRYGEEARNRKPVGIHWMQAPFAAVARATGVAVANPIWPYRIPSLLGGIAAVLLTYRLGRHVAGERAALLGAAMLAASVLLAAETHIAKTDAVLLALTTACALLLGRAYLDPGGMTSRHAAGFWLAMGAAVLVKGPIAPLLIGLTIAALLVADRHVRGAHWLRGLRAGWGLPLALLVVLPWFIAIFIATGGQFFRDALGGDFAGKAVGGAEAHGGPPGYYVLLAPLLLFPATVPVLLALPAAWRARARPLTRFLLAWALPFWVLFELVPTKLPHYVLPAFPALCLLGARWLEDASSAPRWAWRWALGGTVAAALVLGFGGAALPVLLLSGPAVALGVAPLAAAAVLFWLAWRARRPAGAFAACLAMPLLTFALLELVLPALRPVWIAPRLREALAEHEPARIANLGFHEPSALFLIGTQMRLLRDPAVAAGFLAAAPGNVVLVNERQIRRFLDAAARAGVEAAPRAEVAGLDYAAGRWVRVSLFVNSAAPAR
jgi:hypothetical protein